MKKFPLDEKSLAALDKIETNRPARRYVFDDWRIVVRRGVDARPAVLNPPAKRAAKHDKRSALASRRDGVKLTLPPERAFDAAGLRHHRWQFVG